MIRDFLNTSLDVFKKSNSNTINIPFYIGSDTLIQNVVAPRSFNKSVHILL